MLLPSTYCQFQEKQEYGTGITVSWNYLITCISRGYENLKWSNITENMFQLKSFVSISKHINYLIFSF